MPIRPFIFIPGILTFKFDVICFDIGLFCRCVYAGCQGWKGELPVKKKKKESLPQAQAGDEAYQMLFENAGDPIFIHDEDGILAVNAKACELLGYTKDELLSMEPSDVDTYEEKINMPGRIARLKSRGTLNFETVHLKKDGTTVSVDVTAKLVIWYGKPAVMSICRDMTRRKHAENILLTAALEWQTTFDSVRDVIFLLDSEARILRCNKAASDMFGSPGKDLLGRKCCEVVHGKAEPIPECPTDRMKKTKRRELLVIKSKDRWLEITADPILDEEGEISGVVHIVSDITELKKKDEDLLSSYGRFKQILEGASEGILIADIKTKMIKYSNPSICRMLGYSSDELADMSIQKIHPAADWAHALSEFEAQSRGDKTLAPEIPCLCKNGRVIYADINTTRITLDGNECNVGFFRDVTERKKSVQELSDSRMLYQDILDNQAAGIYRICVKKSESWSSTDDPPYSYEFMNERYCELTGATREEHMADPTLTMKLVHPDDWKRWIEDNEVSHTRLKPFFWDGRLIVRGKVVWVHYESRPRELPNGDRVWTGILLDISERMKAEEGLNQSLSLLNATLESTTDGILVVDNNGKFSYSNSKFAQMWSIPQEIMSSRNDDMALNHVLQQLKNPELFLNKVKYLYIHPEEDSFDVIEFKDGRIFERYSQPQRIAGKPVGRVWNFRDVTMARKAAESLERGERKYRSLVETTNTGYVVIDTEGRVLDANQEYVRLAGKDELKQIVGRKVTEWTADYEKKKNAEAVKKCAIDGHVRNLEIDYVDSSGKITPIEINGTVVNSDEGPRILTLCRDITERRKAMEALQKSETIIQNISNNLASGMIYQVVVMKDGTRRITYLSHNVERFYGITPQEGIADASLIYGRIHPEDRDKLIHDEEEAIHNMSVFRSEVRMINPDGGIRWSSFASSPHLLPDGTTCWDGIEFDITGLKKAEEELRRHRDHLEEMVEERATALVESEKNYRELVENTNSIILRMDNVGKVTFFNEFAQSFFGFSGEEIIGRNVVGTIVPVKDTNGTDLEDMILEIGNHPEKFRNNMNENMRKSGERVWIAWTNKPIFDGNGKIVEVMCIGNDITERVKTEKELDKYRNRLEELVEERTEELRNSEDRFQKIVEQSPMSMAIVGMDGTIEYINRKAVETFGYLHEDIPNMDRWYVQAYPDEKYRKAVISTWMGLVEKGIVGNHEIEGREYRVTCKNGIVKTMFIFGVPVSNKVFVMFDDISERKRVETELIRSEEKYRQLHESMIDAFVLTDMEGRIMETNRSYQDMLGYSEKELHSIAYSDLTPSKWHDMEMNIVNEQILKKGYSDVYEKEYRRKDGAVIPVELRTFLILDENKSPSAMWAIVRNLTERKKTEQALRDSEERFRTIFEKGPIGMATVDRNNNFIKVNPTFSRMLGYSEQELGLLSYKDVTHPEHIEADIRNVEDLSKGRINVYQTEKRYVRKDKSLMWGSLTLSAINDHNGKFLYFLAMLVDITERKMIEERLRQSEKMEAIGQLAGGIAHDFNNQLMGIMGYAEMLYDRLDDESLRKDAENILRISRRSSDLTKEMLAFARKGKYQAVPVNIHKLIEEVISLLSHSIDKRIEIKRILKASPATIMGDPTQLQGAILNLAINARDAMPKGGELVFTTETMEMDDSYFSDVKKILSNRYLKICIIDNGTGMDSETIKHIFEPFFTTKEPGKGTGMGLASVYGTVNTHNGIINVESTLGKGSVFSIFFPLYEEEIESEESKPEPDVIRKEANILLVDDEEIVRDMVAKMLRSFGHKVVICKDGLEALEYYKQSWSKIDLVVLDMMMPRMNGRDSFIGMRTVNPDIRAVLMSGYSIDEEVQSLLDAGMKGFIQKPFNTKELNKEVESALKGGK
ncbi:MAG TPA: hypothetical protein DET40_04600 [Lentisphaeria bacterium]|nr:MAG: hypothetical protein A2X45_21520 [Lentisphaerae bacterium GWF2_50_93]HCE42805.1 hypothetical protein [Lentisphaeria bacterium]